MKGKRFGRLLLTLALAMTLTACGEKPETPAPPIPDEPPAGY